MAVFRKLSLHAGPAFLACCLFALLLYGCNGRSRQVRTSETFLALDTVIEITVYGSDEGSNREILEGAKELCQWYEELFSITIETSDISRFNAAAGPVQVDPHTAEVVELGLHYSEASRGVFDITIAPVSSLWNFGESGAIPPAEEIAAGLKLVGYRKVIAKDLILDKQDGAQLDLGGIAKGYIADKLGYYLRENGVENALINLGGNILALGRKPDNTPWTIGLEKPFAENGDWICRIALSEGSIVTSGISQRYFLQDGMIYHHLLDTATGYPVQNGLYSVSILSKTSVEAEALSTTCFLLGLDAGMELVNRTPGVEAVFVDSSYRIYQSENLETAYEIQWEKASLSD